MNAQAIICILLVWILSSANAMTENTNESDAPRITFDTLNNRAQQYIIKSLSHAVQVSDVAVLHTRSDEWLRKDKNMDYRVRIVLGLLKFRFSAMLKGCSSISAYDILYIYAPKRQARGQPVIRVGRPRREEDFASPYFASLSPGDNLMRLVFIERQMAPLRERVLEGYRNRTGMREIVENALAMSEDELMDKYNLRDVFADRVYQVVEGCVFRVDYPAPEMPETEAMRMNAVNQKLSEARVPDLQKMSNLVHLSAREVSEIVFIAYMLEGDEGLAQYAAISRSSPILLPIAEPIFKTEIGKKLFEALNLDQDSESEQEASLP
jgi:hypothetical protein